MKNETIVNIEDSDWDIRVNPRDEAQPNKLLFQAEVEEFQIREENSCKNVFLKFLCDFTKTVFVIGVFALIIWDFLRDPY